jgi:uncharacterized protein YyaL (SSP411 family)
LPGRAIASGSPGAGDQTPPWPVALLQGKQAVDGMPTAYVCRGRVCGAPAGTVEALREQLEGLAQAKPKAR